MPDIKLIISDLHLADGQPLLDGFGEAQQAALEGLIAATGSTGPLGNASDIELIINGDCFDFVVVPPYDLNGMINNSTAMEKMKKIVTAHPHFFEALSHFIEQPGHHLTFITGNHDIELCFPEVCAYIAETIGVALEDRRVYFCPTRFYLPLPDVYIEHGNQYDFWNQASAGVWDEEGQLINPHLESIALPAGTLYFQHAAYPISMQYNYFDHFEPPMNTIRQYALLCLLNPDIVIEVISRVMELLAPPRPALDNLAPGEEHIPARLFEQAMLDFAAFQQDTEARRPQQAKPRELDREQARANTLIEYNMLRETLALPLIEAVTAICTPATYQMGEDVARGMHAVLSSRPQLRYAIAGHTHMARIDPINNGTQSYLNTSSWTTHFAQPAPGDVTPALVEWLRKPDWSNIPLRDVTQRIFAMVTSSDSGPSSASLCVWEGGSKGSYRVLA